MYEAIEKERVSPLLEQDSYGKGRGSSRKLLGASKRGAKNPRSRGGS
jgi:hypothetical protein